MVVNVSFVSCRMMEVILGSVMLSWVRLVVWVGVMVVVGDIY